MNHTIKLSLLTLAILTTHSNAHQINFFGTPSSDMSDVHSHVNTIAIDTDLRQGWMASIGLGFHSTSLDNDYYGNIATESGLASSLKIGYNFTEQFSVQYVRNVSWYTPNDDLKSSGIMGLGVTYYFQPQAETWYIGATAGIGDNANIDEEISDTGSAFMLTLGYEFSPHWQIEGSLLSASIDQKSPHETIDTSSVQFLLNYSWY